MKRNYNMIENQTSDDIMILINFIKNKNNYYKDISKLDYHPSDIYNNFEIVNYINKELDNIFCTCNEDKIYVVYNNKIFNIMTSIGNHRIIWSIEKIN